MCLPQLGLRLDGNQSGAILLFRGAELKHYVAPWEGDGEHGFRYAFDHTTHESVRRWCQGKKSDGGYQKPVSSRRRRKTGSKESRYLASPPKTQRTKARKKNCQKDPKGRKRARILGQPPLLKRKPKHPSLWSLRNHRLTQQSSPQNVRLTTKTTKAKARPGTSARSDLAMASHKEQPARPSYRLHSVIGEVLGHLRRGSAEGGRANALAKNEVPTLAIALFERASSSPLKTGAMH